LIFYTPITCSYLHYITNF